MDSGKAVAHTLLDLSVVFDTTEYNILFNSIKDYFWVDGTVLRWINSYLSNRRQKVKIVNSFSDAFSLPYGVPQGSVLDPLLLTCYTTPSVISFPVSMSITIYMQMTPKYLALDIGTLILVSLSSPSVSPVFKSRWMV